MSSAPSMPLFPDAYLADTTHLFTEEHGAYFLLLMAMWRRSGSVPNDDKDLARIVGLTVSKWLKIKARLMPFLTIENDGELGSRHLIEFRIRAGRHPIPSATRKLVFERDGFVCAYCGDISGPFHMDHIYPVSRGGTNDPENLTPACIPCNMSKRDKTLSEWQQ